MTLDADARKRLEELAEMRAKLLLLRAQFEHSAEHGHTREFPPADCEDYAADLRALLSELDRLSAFVAAVDDLVASPGRLAEMATRIVENIEQVDHWIDDRSLVTAHAHASVLRDDLPIALSELDHLQGGEGR